MKNFIISLLMCLMIWTVVDINYHGATKYVLENSSGERKIVAVLFGEWFHNPIIIGDKVEIIKYRWGSKTLQRVEE